MDTSTKVAVIALLIIGLSASTVVFYPMYARNVWKTTYEPEYAISAHELTEKPEKFIHLDNPDQYTSQAIAHPNEYLNVKQKDTQINQLITEHGTNNVEVNGSYYQIYVIYVDAFPPEVINIPLVVDLGYIVLFHSVVVLVIALAVKLVKRKPGKNPMQVSEK